MQSDDRLDALFLLWQEMNSNGRSATPEVVCQDCPELLSDFRLYLQAVEWGNQLLDTPSIPLAETAEAHPNLPNSNHTLPVIPGYAVQGEIARGGMGMVLAARDLRLNRDVAIKVLLEERSSPEAKSRFVREAKIAARLSHPGISPVHELGMLPDGSPYLAMKLIQGKTLAELLKQRSMSAEELLGFVQIFEQISHAVGFAHSQSILHRDLKPLNVMVGAFGEVQVMDWGLAKSLGVEEPMHGPTDISWPEQQAEGLSRRETKPGAVMGTLAYMAPEQANSGPVDARTDVFALGAILCEILTGDPPYTSTSKFELFRLAREGEVADAFARLDLCGADSELIALAKRCLSAQAASRYTNGSEVANAVAAWRRKLDERVRTAERERAAAEAKAAEQRKRRRVQLALSGSIALILFGGGVVAWWQDRQATRQRNEQTLQAERERTRLARNADAIDALLTRCENGLRNDETAVAAAAWTEVEQRFSEGGAEHLRERMDRCRQDLTLARELDRIDNYGWTPKDDKRLPNGDELASLWLTTFENYGVIPGRTPPQESVEKIKASLIRNRLFATLDLCLALTKSEDILAILNEGDPNRFRSEVRAGIRERKYSQLLEAAPLLALAQDDPLAKQPFWFLAALGQMTFIPDPLRRSLLERAWIKQPKDFNTLMGLARTYPGDAKENLAQRIRWCQAAITSRPLSTAAWIQLSDALIDQADDASAVKALRQVIRIDPDLAVAHTLLVSCLRQLGKIDAALDACRETLRIDANSWMAHELLGEILSRKGDPLGAIKAFKESIRIKPDHAMSHHNLGVVLRDVGQLDEAITAHRKAIQIDSKYAAAHHALGIALKDRGDLDGAITSYRKAIELNPKSAKAHSDLAVALKDNRDPKNAIIAAREAIRLDPNYAPAHYNLGLALDATGDLKNALASFRETVRIDPTLALGHSTLGIALQEIGDKPGAIAAYRTAVRLDPKLANAKINLGGLLLERREMGEATRLAREVVATAPQYAHAHVLLGLCLQASGDLSGARKALTHAAQLDPQRFGPILGSLPTVETEQIALGPLDSLFQQKTEQIPALAHLRITLQIARKQASDARVTAERFANWAEQQKEKRNEMRYNAACLFALCAPSIEHERESLVDRCINILRKAHTDGYFDEKKLAHFQQDPDFDGVRSDPKFVSFLKEIVPVPNGTSILFSAHRSHATPFLSVVVAVSPLDGVR